MSALLALSGHQAHQQTTSAKQLKTDMPVSALGVPLLTQPGHPIKHASPTIEEPLGAKLEPRASNSWPPRRSLRRPS